MIWNFINFPIVHQMKLLSDFIALGLVCIHFLSQVLRGRLVKGIKEVLTSQK